MTFQAAFTPTEAFVVAVRHVVASLDPLFMANEARVLLATLGDLSGEAVVIWAFDRLEGSEDTSVVFPSADEYIEPIRRLPEVEPEESTVIQEIAAKLRYLCDEVSDGEE